MPASPIVTPRMTDPVTGVELVPFTCPWAQAGLANALEGMNANSAGVKKYHIGSRGVEYITPSAQVEAVAYWDAMVTLYCGTPGLPTSVTGRDTATRVIPRDL
jgi:hypothetical protein